MRPSLSPWCLVAALGACAACQPGSPAPTAAPAKTTGAVVATVNGVAITEAELTAVLKPAAHGAETPAAERRRQALTALERDELLKQKALEAGLAPDGTGADEVARAEALLATARRHALAEAYLKHLAKQAEPSEADARAFFAANQALLRTEYHLQQLLLRDEAQIAQAHKDLKAGAPFDEVARRQFAGLPEGVGQPWDLGFLGWKLLPEAWRPVLGSLQPGQTSDVIKGPNGRFWLLKLVETRQRTDLTFEEVKPLLVEDLRRARLEQLTAQAEQDLRRSARIVEP